MDSIDALSDANAGFASRLRLVTTDDWKRSTPCEEWDVRALVNHVIGANRRYVMLLDGAPAEAVDATRSVDHLGDGPVGSFASTAAELVAAFGEAGALTRTLHHPAGNRSGAELIAMRALDVAVHSWDLARAIGAEETLDPDVVEYLLALSYGFDPTGQQGAFAAPVVDSPDASPQTRLLHLSGRRPDTR